MRTAPGMNARPNASAEASPIATSPGLKNRSTLIRSQQWPNVRAATDIPIAAGESFFTRFEFQPFVTERALDILQPDPAIAGGITEVVRIAALASAHQLTVAPHLWGSALLFAAGLHIAAATPNVTTLEYSMGFNPMLRGGLTDDTFTFRDGYVEIPDRPGLGVSINEDFVQKYKYATTT